MSTDGSLSRIEDLVLARLLVSGEKGETRAKIASDLEPVVQHRYAGASWKETLDAALENLRRTGRIEAGKGGKRFHITESGREQARAFLGVSRLPEKTTWSTLKNVYLFARAMNVPLDSPDKVKKLSTVTGVRAVLLREGYDLDLDPTPTQAQAVDALLWKQLGRNTQEPFSASAVKAWLLSQLLGAPAKIGVAPLVAAAAAKTVEARRSDRAALCQAALRRLLEEESAPTPEPVPPPEPTPPLGPELDPEEFARRVLEAARASRTGWFGNPGVGGKVFISHVYRSYCDLYPEAALTLEAFKERLIEVNRRGLIRLSRADLPNLMDPADVRASETRYLNAVFHFVSAEG